MSVRSSFVRVCVSQESELERLTSAREAENKFIRDQNELEIDKTKEMAAIETQKFKDMVSSIGPDTIASIANSGPEMKVRPNVLYVGHEYKCGVL